jgi:hypothetical protein
LNQSRHFVDGGYPVNPTRRTAGRAWVFVTLAALTTLGLAGVGALGGVGFFTVVVGAVVVAVVVVAGAVVAGAVVVAGGAVVAAGAAHVDLVIVFVSSVTAPLRARTRPSTVAPVVSVMLCSARMVPRKLDPVPSVAELPTCQKTLQACAPFVKLTTLPDAVVSVEPAWNTNTALALPPPSSVSAPVRPIEEAEL